MKIEITGEIKRKAMDAYMRSDGMSFEDNLNSAIEAVASLIVTDEIERLRAHNTALLALNEGFDKANRQHLDDIEEALRLMEPMVDGSCSVDFVHHEHFEAIADFVTRMRGE